MIAWVRNSIRRADGAVDGDAVGAAAGFLGVWSGAAGGHLEMVAWRSQPTMVVVLVQ